MKKKFRIIYNRNDCIGAASCSVFSDKFQMAEDDKADLIGSKEENERFILEIDESELQEIIDAAKSCPVNVIEVYDIENNEKIA